MSEALERVIAEQQERLDRMEKMLKSMDRNSEYRRRKGEIFATAVVNFQARAMRTIITDPETRDKWTATNQWLRQEIKDFGFCVNCNCLDYCQCDILVE